MANEPVKGSIVIAGVKPNLDVNNQQVPCQLIIDDSLSPPAVRMDIADRALRDLGFVDTIETPPTVTLASSAGTAITSATNTTAVSAPGSGNKLRIYRLHATNSSSTGTFVYWCDGAGGTKYYPMYLLQGAVVSLRIDGRWNLTANTLLSITTSAAGNVEWSVEYQSVAV